MTAFIFIVVALAVFEIIKMNKQGLRNEKIVYIAISVISIAFAVYYFVTGGSVSFSKLVLNLLNITP